MRNLFIGLLFLVAIAIGWWLPMFRPLAPSAQVPTFSQSLQDQALVERAAVGGKLQPDEQLQAMRQRMVTAARRLEDFPCDKARREELRAATVTFIKEKMRRVRSGKDGEYVTVNGRTVDASTHFNREVVDIFEETLFQGVLRPGDLPMPIGAGQMPSFAMDGKRGRFVCETEAPR